MDFRCLRSSAHSASPFAADFCHPTSSSCETDRATVRLSRLRKNFQARPLQFASMHDSQYNLHGEGGWSHRVWSTKSAIVSGHLVSSAA